MFSLFQLAMVKAKRCKDMLSTHAVPQRSVNVCLDSEQHAGMWLTSVLHTTIDVCQS